MPFLLPMTKCGIQVMERLACHPSLSCRVTLRVCLGNCCVHYCRAGPLPSSYLCLPHDRFPSLWQSWHVCLGSRTVTQLMLIVNTAPQCLVSRVLCTA